jgi:hypothetical protein
MGAVAMNKNEPGPAVLAPGEKLDFRSQHRDPGPFGLHGQSLVEPGRRRRSAALERRQGRGDLRREIGLEAPGLVVVERRLRQGAVGLVVGHPVSLPHLRTPTLLTSV